MEATANKMAEKITLRIASSHVVLRSMEDGAALFQDLFARPENGFVQRAVMRAPLPAIGRSECAPARFSSCTTRSSHIFRTIGK